MHVSETHVTNKNGIRIDYYYGHSKSVIITQHYWPNNKKAQFSDMPPTDFSEYAQTNIVGIWHIKNLTHIN